MFLISICAKRHEIVHSYMYFKPTIVLQTRFSVPILYNFSGCVKFANLKLFNLSNWVNRWEREREPDFSERNAYVIRIAPYCDALRKEPLKSLGCNIS